MYHKSLRDSATNTCSVTGCIEKATTGINNQDYCDKHFEEQRKAVKLKLKELTGMDEMTDQSIDLDTIIETHRKLILSATLDVRKFKGIQKIDFADRQAKQALLLWADQRAISMLPEKTTPKHKSDISEVMTSKGFNWAIDLATKAFKGGEK